jgi:hypothetical protein
MNAVNSVNAVNAKKEQGFSGEAAASPLFLSSAFFPVIYLFTGVPRRFLPQTFPLVGDLPADVPFLSCNGLSGLFFRLYLPD